MPENSCKHLKAARGCPTVCNKYTCNVRCHRYVWDGETEPSTSIEGMLEEASELARVYGLAKNNVRRPDDVKIGGVKYRHVFGVECADCDLPDQYRWARCARCRLRRRHFGLKKVDDENG